jgi:hypothetical protein
VIITLDNCKLPVQVGVPYYTDFPSLMIRSVLRFINWLFLFHCAVVLNPLISVAHSTA